MKFPTLTKTQKITGAALAALLVVAVTAGVAHCPSTASDPNDVRARGISGATLPPGRPILSVKSFGAVGDGSTDDRTAITNAISAASVLTAAGVELFFPPGTYRVTRNASNSYAIDVPASNFTISGVPGKSIIQAATGMPNASVAVIRIDAKSNVVIRDMVVDGNWQNAATYIRTASNAASLPQGTINVNDATDFPSGSFSAVLPSTAGTQYITCTGKTSTTLTGCSGGTGIIYVNGKIGRSDTEAGLNHTTQTSRSTTIAAGSDTDVLPQATIDVASTASFTGFASGDTVTLSTSLGFQDVTCTGTTGTSFTGCTGGTGTLSTGGEVFNGSDPKNYGIMIRGSQNVTLEGVKVKRTYGDCVWIGTGSAGGIGAESRGVRIVRTDCDMSARDGIAIAGGASGVVVDNVKITNVIASAFDTEPVSNYVRDIVVQNSLIGTWFAPEIRHGISLTISGGRSEFTQANSIRNFRARNNTILGPVLIQRATDVTLENNRIVQDYAAASEASPVLVQFNDEDVVIKNNYIYTRALAGTAEGGSDLAGIQIGSSQSGSVRYEPSSITVTGNQIHTRNGRYGIWMKGAGGAVDGTTFTSTAVDATTLTCSGCSFTVNAFIGWLVRCGTSVASIDSNTATVITLEPSTIGGSPGWTTPLGDPAPTPSTGTCNVIRYTSMVDVDGNYVEGTDDGYGKGRGIRVTQGSNESYGVRVRIRRNVIRNVDTDAISVKWSTVTPYPYVEITDNFAHDDQANISGGNTTTNLLKFTNAINATKLVMRGNTKGEGVTNQTSGLSAGTWTVNDGICPEFAGYGTPEAVVTAPICASYRRVDGSTSTSQYNKESGTGNTGWIAK